MTISMGIETCCSTSSAARPGPLRDDGDVVVGYIGIGFDGKLMERNRTPDEQQQRSCQDQKAILQREIYQLADHLPRPFVIYFALRHSRPLLTELSSLLHRGLENQCVGYHASARFDSTHDLLHVIGEHVPANHLNSPKTSVFDWRVNPFTVVQMKNRRGRYRRAPLLRFSVEGRGNEHSRPASGRGSPVPT